MAQDDSLGSLTDLVRSFCEERDWDQFHDPKNLAIGMITEAAELLERFRFLTDEQALYRMDDPGERSRIEAELADVLFFTLRFAQRFDVDLAAALRRKLVLNATRYPVDKARGRNLKYTEL